MTGLRRAISVEREPWALTYGQRLVLVTALGAALRLVTLGNQPLGYDEDFTAVVVRLPLADMLATIGRDSAPPLYYLLERAAILLGASPAPLRLVSALAGIALIPLLAALARRVAGDAGGLAAGAFVAVLPAAVVLSQNARMYALGGTLAAAAALLVWRAVEVPSRRRWIAFGLVAAAAAWTDYFDAIALAAILLACAWLRPPRGTLLVAGLVTAAAILSLVPWLVFAAPQLGHVQAAFWVEPLGIRTVAGTIGQSIAGPELPAALPLHDAMLVFQAVALAAGLLAFGTIVVAWRQLAAVPAPAAGPRGAVFLAIAGAAGVAILVVVSLWRPLLEARYASVMWLPLFALAGLSLAFVPVRVRVAILAALAVPSLVLTVGLTHPQASALVPEIEARLSVHDFVSAEPQQYLVLLADGSPALRARLHVVSADPLPWFDGTAAYPSGAVVPAVPADVVLAGGRVLAVAAPSSAPPALPSGYAERERVCVVGACLTVFGPPG